ncbi:hypothetical protein D3C84_1228150 [compost metagenome]
MLQNYYVNDNAQDNGDHEVHVSGCPRLKEVKSSTFLGSHDQPLTAVIKAQTIYPQSDGAYCCCRSSHTS